MPLMDQDQLDTLKADIAKARKKDMPFGLCLGKKPENMVMLTDKLKTPEVMARRAKKAGETSKVLGGMLSVKGKKIILIIEDDPLPGMAKTMKKFFSGTMDMPMKVAVLDPGGQELDSDGEDEGDDAVDANAETNDAADDQNTDTSEPDADSEAAQSWRKIHGAMTPKVQAFAASGDARAPAVQKAWAGAEGAAEQNNFAAAMEVAKKLGPIVSAAPAAQENPAAAKWTGIADNMSKLLGQALPLNPPNGDKLQAAWAMATEKADAKDFDAAIKIAERLQPALEKTVAALATAPETDAKAQVWEKLQRTLMALYDKAMANQPSDSDRSTIDTAWGMALEKAELNDFETAIKIGERLKPRLEQVAAAENAGLQAEIPADVVAFHTSRLLWADTRNQMMTEVQKVEKAIVDACSGDPDLQEIVNEVTVLSGHLKEFDDRLQDALDEIINSPIGDGRAKLKSKASKVIQDYKALLEQDFFKDIDTNNGFANVNVRGAALASLQTIESNLAA